MTTHDAPAEGKAIVPGGAIRAGETLGVVNHLVEEGKGLVGVVGEDTSVDRGEEDAPSNALPRFLHFLRFLRMSNALPRFLRMPTVGSGRRRRGVVWWVVRVVPVAVWEVVRVVRDCV